MTAGDRARVRRIADGIVTAHASYRRRVRWAVVAGVSVAVAAAVPSLLVLDRSRTTDTASSSQHSSSPQVRGVPDFASASARTMQPTVIGAVPKAHVYAAALRRWRPHDVIRVYRASATPLLRAELRTMLGPRLHFVATRTDAAILDVGGRISFPRASSTRGSSS